MFFSSSKVLKAPKFLDSKARIFNPLTIFKGIALIEKLEYKDSNPLKKFILQLQFIKEKCPL